VSVKEDTHAADAADAGQAAVEQLSAPLGGADAYVLCRRDGTTYAVIDEATSAVRAAEIMIEVRQMAGLPVALLAETVLTLAHEAGMCDCQAPAD
jgi:hypothetical protein